MSDELRIVRAAARSLCSSRLGSLTQFAVLPAQLAFGGSRFIRSREEAYNAPKLSVDRQKQFGSALMSLVEIIAVIAAVSLAAVLARSWTRQRQKIRHLELQLLQQGEALGNCERQRELLFSGNPYPMWSLDRKTFRFLTVNDAAIRHY